MYVKSWKSFGCNWFYFSISNDFIVDAKSCYAQPEDWLGNRWGLFPFLVLFDKNKERNEMGQSCLPHFALHSI